LEAPQGDLNPKPAVEPDPEETQLIDQPGSLQVPAPPALQPASPQQFQPAPQQRQRKRQSGQRFTAEAATVYKPLTAIALIYFVLGLVGLILVAVMYAMVSGLFASMGQGGSAVFLLIGGFVVVVIGLLSIYLQFLLLKAAALGLKYLSVIADRS
jgi:hypothetical protein